MADSKKEFDIEKYYKNLSRAFKGGTPVFRQRLATKITPPGQTHSPIGTARAFLKSTTNLYASQMASYGMYSRLARMSDYSEMESNSIIASALDIYSDEICTKDEHGEMIKIFSHDQKIRKILDSFFYQVLNIDFNLWTWVRNFCKYGDQFLLVDHHPNHGILQILPMPVNEVEREEGFDQNDPLAYRYRWTTQGNRTLDPWQVIHFRNGGNDNFMPYGCSIIESVRRTWRQVVLLEDAVMTYRIVRCLHENSRIWTETGYKKIKDIQVGDKVYSFDKNLNKLILTNVLNKVNNGTQQIWKIKSQHRTIKCNFNHPILVKDKKTDLVNYIQADKLIPKRHQFVLPEKNDDGISIPVKLKEENYEWFGQLTDAGKKYFQTIQFPNKSKRLVMRELSQKHNYVYNRINQFLYAKDTKGIPYEIAVDICNTFGISLQYLIKFPKGMFNLNRLNLPDFVNEEFARFFGFMVGDGFLSKNFHSIGFATGLYKDNNDYYANILKKYCSSATFAKDKRNPNSEIGKVYVNSFYLSHLMSDMGFTSSVYTKKVPDWIFQSSNKIKEAFIDGLVDADGHRRTMKKTESMELGLCNEQILEGVKELAHQLGWNVSSEIKKRFRQPHAVGDVWIKNPTTCYELYLTKQKSKLYENIISVEKTEEHCDVYDITVSGDFNNFIADGVVVHNSPERRVFYIDVGGIDPNDVPVFIEKVKGQLKRNQTIDQPTGQLDKRYNPMSILDDYYIPVRGDMTSTRIESLPGGQYVGDIDDLNYHRDKLFAGLKIPKSYLGYEGEVNARSTLSQEDINFARTIARLQNIVVAELNKMAIIQLFSAGYRGEELMNFDLSMASPSIITEIQRLELWRTRFEVASVAASLEGGFDRKFAYKKLFKLSDEEIEEIEEGRRKDKLFDIELEGIAPPAPAGGELPPEGEVPPGPEGGLSAGEAPAAAEPTGEPPTPDAEAPITTAGRDPNQQRIMPNPVKGKTKKRKFANGLPSNLMSVFSTKKTALDPRDGLIQNTRVATTPFGEETLTMGRMLNEDIDVADEELSRHQLQSRLLQHEQLLRQLEGVRWNSVKTSPPPVGSPVEPIEDREKQEKEDEIWDDAQKQEGE